MVYQLIARQSFFAQWLELLRQKDVEATYSLLMVRKVDKIKLLITGREVCKI